MNTWKIENLTKNKETISIINKNPFKIIRIDYLSRINNKEHLYTHSTAYHILFYWNKLIS